MFLLSADNFKQLIRGFNFQQYNEYRKLHDVFHLTIELFFIELKEKLNASIAISRRVSNSHELLASI